MIFFIENFTQLHTLTVMLNLLYLFVNFDYGLCLDNLQGWNYINLHCRDNDNKPVDWWYIYKPPIDVVPYLELGRNFSFITPDTAGRWQSSDKYITANSMLQHTLSPMFRRQTYAIQPTYADYLAIAAYDEQQGDDNFSGSSARGILMADELGGLWIGHTVSGMPDLSKDRPTFPEEESPNGHLIMCLSLDLVTINEIAATIQQVAPKFTHVKIPTVMESLLPEWNFFGGNSKRSVQSELWFHTTNRTLKGLAMFRRPGEKRNLYRNFAEAQEIVLDVYSQTPKKVFTTVCGNIYSVRRIDAISLKLSDQVYYIKNSLDKSRFAVSTAAHWQRSGARPIQYWTCFSNLDKDDKLWKGGILICVENYNVWLSFDNFKIKEPEC